MSPSLLLASLLALYLTLSLSSPVFAGNCWEMIGANGKCQGLVRAFTTQEDCCSLRGAGSTLAFSADDLDHGALFRYNALLGGAPNCQSCRKTCEGVDCGKNKVCQMQNSRPKCICQPDCEHLPTTRVCGSDGKTYRNHCSLLQHNCHFARNVRLNYYGKCRSTCSRVTCPSGKSCIIDDNHRRTHCVTCSATCSSGLERRPLCGMDGRTYDNDCEIRAASCRKGASIPVAYLGECQEFASCLNLTCSAPNLKCLTHLASGRPRCADCNIVCSGAAARGQVRVCGSDGRTYSSYCELRRAGCRDGVVLETLHVGACVGSGGVGSGSAASGSKSSSPLKRRGKTGLGAGKRRKLSKKERRARRRMQRRMRLEAKRAMLGGAARGFSGAKRLGGTKKFGRRTRPFKHPQSSLAVKRAAPASNQL